MIRNYLNIISGSRRRVASSYDADAQDYFDRIVVAGSSINTGNKDAINAFVVGCKADSIWADMVSVAILCASNTLAGSLVPLKGANFTNNGFIEGDYSRTLGITGDLGSYIDTNLAGNTLAQNDFHMAVWMTGLPTYTTTRVLCGNGTTGTGASNIYTASGGAIGARNRTSGASTQAAGTGDETGMYATDRAGSTGFKLFYPPSAAISLGLTSQTSDTSDFCVFARAAGNSPTNARLSFFSFGNSFTLSLLNSRLATLMAAIT